MHYITLLSPEQQAFDTVSTALGFMGVDTVQLLTAACEAQSVSLTILLTAESLWHAQDLLASAFCDDIQFHDLTIVYLFEDSFRGYYRVTVVVPEVQYEC